MRPSAYNEERSGPCCRAGCIKRRCALDYWPDYKRWRLERILSLSGRCSALLPIKAVVASRNHDFALCRGGGLNKESLSYSSYRSCMAPSCVSKALASRSDGPRNRPMHPDSDITSVGSHQCLRAINCVSHLPTGLARCTSQSKQNCKYSYSQGPAAASALSSLYSHRTHRSSFFLRAKRQSRESRSTRVLKRIISKPHN